MTLIRRFLRNPTDPDTTDDGRIFTRPELVRSAAIALAIYACNGTKGRGVGDPIFEAVTEGRQSAQNRAKEKDPSTVHYSACGDLANWVELMLGDRNKREANRQGGGIGPWRTGGNISTLVYSGGHYTPARAGQVPLEGCILHWSPPDHVDVLLEIFGDVFTTGDYGSWTRELGDCGYQRAATVASGIDGLIHTGRTLVGWVDPAELDLTESACVPEDFVGGVDDDNPYPEDGILLL